MRAQTAVAALAAGLLASLITVGCALVGAQSACGPLPAADMRGPAPAAGTRTVDLAQQLGAGRLRAVNRSLEAVPDVPGAVRLSDASGEGVAWLEGSEFARGTIAVMACGRDLAQRSFLGLAFHRLNDQTYEAVYLRPFNFRSDDPARRGHAVQYIAVPAYDWPRLRREFPEQFEHGVDASVAPTAWVPLRVVVDEHLVQVFVGTAASPALEVRRLGAHGRGQVGLWTGNGSDGAFANLQFTPSE